MKYDAFTLTEAELSYVIRLVAKDRLEKKRKLEIAKKQFENVDAFFQRIADAHLKIIEEKEEGRDEQ